MGHRLRVTANQHTVCSTAKLIAAQVLGQAMRDARSSNPRVRDDALCWLNTPEARALVEGCGVRWGVGLAQITLKDLPSRIRNTSFPG